MQETNFPVEILIHDDASTDGTADIVRQYQSRFPSLIRTTLQKENQFSKGKMVNASNFKKAKGEYIALCHGDDYWIDKVKLQKQLIVMQKYNVGISGHPAKEIDTDGKDLNRVTGVNVDTATHFEAIDLIRRNGNMLPFGSIMMTAKAKDDMLMYMPPVMFHTGIQLLAALKNGLVVLPDVMMAYRVDVPGSTTEIMLGNIENRSTTGAKRTQSIKRLKILYGPKYYCEMNKLLARQMNFLAGKKLTNHGFLVLRSILKDEKVLVKIMLFSMIVFYGVRTGIKRLIKLSRLR